MKVTVVGAGAVGASCAEYIAMKDFASEVVLVDIKEGFAEGKAMDLMQTASLNGFDTKITGTTGDYSKTAGSKVAVITSGIPRKPGMTREELIGINAGIVKEVTENLVKHSKHEQITLINRTKDKAERIANKLNVVVKDYADLQLEIQKADVLVVATGALNPTVDKTILNLKKPLLILDLSIPKNVNANVMESENVTLIHMDQLAQMADETLENRKKHIPAAEAIIEEIKDEFIAWTKQRKFAPTIHALKAKLNTIKEGELNFQRKKIANFDEEQAELISARIIQKITNHFANHLKDDQTMVDESIEWIEKIFQIETLVK